VTFYKGGASNSHILSTCHLRLNWPFIISFVVFIF
jgi:hypothetical protein